MEIETMPAAANLESPPPRCSLRSECDCCMEVICGGCGRIYAMGLVEEALEECDEIGLEAAVVAEKLKEMSLLEGGLYKGPNILGFAAEVAVPRPALVEDGEIEGSGVVSLTAIFMSGEAILSAKVLRGALRSMTGKNLNREVRKKLMNGEFASWHPYEGYGRNVEYGLDLRELLERKGIKAKLRRSPACDGWLYDDKKRILVLLELEFKGSATYNAGKFLLYIKSEGKFRELGPFHQERPEKVILIHLLSQHLTLYENQIAEAIKEEVENAAKGKKLDFEYIFVPGFELPDDIPQAANRVVSKVTSVLKSM